jgi:hypothetical protein
MKTLVNLVGCYEVWGCWFFPAELHAIFLLSESRVVVLLTPHNRHVKNEGNSIL